MKIPSNETNEFIEQIVVDFGLENDLIENDPTLKQALAKSKNLSSRIATKLFYSKKVKEAFESQKPISDVLVSAAISKITKDILNKEIDASQFSSVLQDKLKISTEVAEEISKKINL
jgi:hypothetical protein